MELVNGENITDILRQRCLVRHRVDFFVREESDELQGIVN